MSINSSKIQSYANFDFLPPELLFIIFNNCDYRSLHNLDQVNKKFQNTLQEYLKYKNIKLYKRFVIYFYVGCHRLNTNDDILWIHEMPFTFIDFEGTGLLTLNNTKIILNEIVRLSRNKFYESGMHFEIDNYINGIIHKSLNKNINKFEMDKSLSFYRYLRSGTIQSRSKFWWIKIFIKNPYK